MNEDAWARFWYNLSKSRVFCHTLFGQLTAMDDYREPSEPRSARSYSYQIDLKAESLPDVSDSNTRYYDETRFHLRVISPLEGDEFNIDISGKGLIEHLVLPARDKRLISALFWAFKESFPPEVPGEFKQKVLDPLEILKGQVGIAKPK